MLELSENQVTVINELFDHAKKALKDLASLGEDLPTSWPAVSQQEKLLTYAYYKQATRGPYIEENVVASWDKQSSIPPLKLKRIAWGKLGRLPSIEAKIGYIKLTINILTPYEKIPQQDLREYLISLSLKERARYHKLAHLREWEVWNSLPRKIENLRRIDRLLAEQPALPPKANPIMQSPVMLKIIKYGMKYRYVCLILLVVGFKVLRAVRRILS